MRYFSLAVSIVISLGLPFGSLPQTLNAASAQGPSFVQRSLAALTGGQSVTDMTATATAHSIAGSEDETGTATLKAVATGSSRLDLTLTSGSRSEIVDSSSASRSGTWSGSDRVAHQTAFQNLLAGSFWFFPAFALVESSSATGAIVTYVGHETHNGQGVEHLIVTQSNPAATNVDLAYSHLTQMDFFLDSTTFLPSFLDFNIHPDNNGLVDIPVEVQFTNYRTVNGAQSPFEVQKFINGSLVLDLQLQTLSVNTGLTAAQVVGQ
jgi:hypothetical protein